MATATSADVQNARKHLNQHGFTVIPNLMDRAKIADLKARVDRMLAHEREQPFDSGDGPAIPSDDGYCSEYGPFVADKEESERVKKRIRADRAREFDTPWPVPPEEVCISFFHLPSIFDDGRSQRIFNLMNKDAAFAPLIEHPVVLQSMRWEGLH